MRELRALKPGRVALALAVASLLAGCSGDGERLPSGWAPVAAVAGCPDLTGLYRLETGPSNGASPYGVYPVDVKQRGRRGGPEMLRITTANASGDALAVDHGVLTAAGAPYWRRGGIALGMARCDGGLVTIGRRGADDRWAAYRVGKDLDGDLLIEYVTGGHPLVSPWGNVLLRMPWHTTTATWSRWRPALSADLAQDDAGARPVAAPMPAASAASTAPPPPLFAQAPTRPGALPMGEAQAIVLSALPDTAVFKAMTPTPRGYELRVSTDDAGAVALLAQKLAREGHFAVAPSAEASDASAPARAGPDVTLELVERGLR